MEKNTFTCGHNFTHICIKNGNNINVLHIHMSKTVTYLGQKPWRTSDRLCEVERKTSICGLTRGLMREEVSCVNPNSTTSLNRAAAAPMSDRQLWRGTWAYDYVLYYGRKINQIVPFIFWFILVNSICFVYLCLLKNTIWSYINFLFKLWFN